MPLKGSSQIEAARIPEKRQLLPIESCRSRFSVPLDKRTERHIV